MNNILRFCFGCIVGVAIGVIVAWFLISENVEYCDVYPNNKQAECITDIQWLKSVEARQVGGYNVISPLNVSNASLFVTFRTNTYPQIWVSDPHTNGIPEVITIIGKGYETGVRLELGTNSKISNLMFLANMAKTNNFIMEDRGFDGEYEHRFGPGRAIAINIDHKWHDTIYTNRKRYVEFSGKLMGIKFIDGKWKVLEDPEGCPVGEDVNAIRWASPEDSR